MMGFHTVREGQRVAVWDRGRVTFVDGPRRLFLWRQQYVQELPRHVAEAGEYLAITFNDGTSEHIRGPVAVWHDPVVHVKVEVRPALIIDSHEAVVVYTRRGADAVRRIIRGPSQFIPAADEWLHEFRWHGRDPKDPRRKIPEALVFNRLRVIPDQTYVDIPNVRTSDDALLVVSLMVFFELADIEVMLDQTHDPIADFINAVGADVIDFAGTRSFEQFKLETERLNALETYANLVRRAERIGYRINKVVYRGYEAGRKLQAMHDEAIEARTRLKLEAETEAQAQTLADLRLEREVRRAARPREMEREQAEHRLGLARSEHEQKLHRLQTSREKRLEYARLRGQMRLEHLREAHRERAGFLQAMQAMEVDLTRYLVARFQHPDRVIRVEGERIAGLHVHDRDGESQ
jgi:hypothetical protein